MHSILNTDVDNVMTSQPSKLISLKSNLRIDEMISTPAAATVVCNIDDVKYSVQNETVIENGKSGKPPPSPLPSTSPSPPTPQQQQYPEQLQRKGPHGRPHLAEIVQKSSHELLEMAKKGLFNDRNGHLWRS